MEDPKKKLPSLPSNYVTLQQLQELKLREQQKQREEEEERERQLQKQREEEEERERQLQKQREEDEEKEREKLLQKSLKTLEAKAPKRFSGKYHKSRFQKDRIIPAVEGEIDGQERKVEEPKKLGKKKLKRKMKVKETLDASLGKLEGDSAGRDRSKSGEISMKISVPTLEIIQKIGDLAICDCEKTGEMDGSGAKSTAEKRGDSLLKQDFEWRTKLVPKIVDREKNGSDGANKRSTATRSSFRTNKKGGGGRPESLRQTLFLDCEKPGELDGSDGVDERSTADKRGNSRRKGLRGRPEEPMRQMVVVDFEKPRKKDGSDEADEKSTAENVVRFQRKTDSGRKPEPVRQIVVADCEKVEVDSFDRADEKSTAENRGFFQKRRRRGGRQEPVRQIVVADCEKRREMDGSYGADESSTAQNRCRFGRRGLRGRAAVYQTWVRKDDISDGAPAGFQCSSRRGRPSGRGRYTETASVL